MLGIETSKQFEARKLKLLENFEPDFIIKEKTELRIFYPKEEKKKMNLYLFNNQESKEQFVLTRYQETGTEKYKITHDLVDDKFLPLITIMQLFDLKQTYIIESEIYKLGDLTIEFSKFYLSSEKNKLKFFFCINNTYGHNYTYTNDFAKDVVSNLFDEVEEKKIEEACDLNFEFLEKYDLIHITDIEKKKMEECELKKDLLEKKNIIKNILSKEEFIDNISSERFPKIKLIQYLLYI